MKYIKVVICSLSMRRPFLCVVHSSLCTFLTIQYCSVFFLQSNISEKSIFSFSSHTTFVKEKRERGTVNALGSGFRLIYSKLECDTDLSLISLNTETFSFTYNVL